MDSPAVAEQRRLRALKIGLPIMAGLALLAVMPAGRHPSYLTAALPSDDATGKRSSPI
jgi:hypothetical protein